jgi:predicted AlkP superfamily phosphohydrolase/phosphomutase
MMENLTRRDFLKKGSAAAFGAPLLCGPFSLAGCSDKESEKRPKRGKTIRSKEFRRVIVLGVDGLDPNILRELFSKGKCPNLKKIALSGFFNSLATSYPPQSPVAWASLATGTNPGQHGIFDFISRDPASYLPDLAIIKVNRGNILGKRDSLFLPVRHGRAFWDVASEAGISCTVIRWPMTFPPDSEGARVLSGLGVPDIKGGLGRYTFYTTAPKDPAEEGREKVVSLSAQGGRIDSFIYGPEMRGLGGKKESKLPLSITSNQDDTLSAEVDGRSITISKGQWSDWISLRFSVGFGKKVRGMAKFYLVETRPNIKLYLSPIQIDPVEPCFPISYPDRYSQDLAERLGRFHTLGLPEDTKALTEGRIEEEAFLSMCDDIMRDQERLFEAELNRFQEGLFASVFFTTDRINHIFWATRDREHALFREDDAKRYGSVIDDYYERIDRTVGLVSGHIDERTLLLILSDHGFASFRRAFHLNSWLVDRGYMALKESVSPDDREGGPLFRLVDWKRTKAYSVGFGGVYLNLIDREGEGIVPSGEAANSLMGRISGELLELIDPKTGIKPMAGVYRREEIYRGDFLHLAPDILVGCRRGYRVSWQTAIGGTPSGIFEDNLKKWTGDHIMDPSEVPGLLLCNRRLPFKGTPTLLDIAPTVLGGLGLPPQRTIEGQSLLDL